MGEGKGFSSQESYADKRTPGEDPETDFRKPEP
jgi:hypothetical protein